MNKKDEAVAKFIEVVRTTSEDEFIKKYVKEEDDEHVDQSSRNSSSNQGEY
ncbi:hypothetical protein [Phascolarctobacterium sp.]